MKNTLLKPFVSVLLISSLIAPTFANEMQSNNYPSNSQLEFAFQDSSTTDFVVMSEEQYEETDGANPYVYGGVVLGSAALAGLEYLRDNGDNATVGGFVAASAQGAVEAAIDASPYGLTRKLVYHGFNKLIGDNLVDKLTPED